MRKTRTYISLLVVTLALCLMSIMIVSFGANDIASGASVLAKSIFTAKDCSITADKSASATDSEFSDKRKGVYIRTTNPAATLTLKSEVSGVFDMDFKVFSSSLGRNDMQSIGFLFEDCASDNSLEIRMTMDAQWNYATTTVHINGSPDGYGWGEMGGTSYGVGVTGLYTEVSFKNVQNKNVDFPQKISFDPKTMACSAMTQNSMYEVLKMTDITHASATDYGKVMTSFEKYNVTIKFDGLISPSNELRPGQMIIYSINGQSMAGSYLTNTEGARLFAIAEDYGVYAGGKTAYTLPTPLAYDVIDGIIPFSGSKSVSLGTVPVQVTNGKFFPRGAGCYTVTYKGTTDSDGMSSSAFVTSVPIRSALRPFTWGATYALNDMTLGKGSKLTLPAMTASSQNRYSILENEVSMDNIADRVDELKVKCIVKQGETIKKTIDNIAEESSYLFETAGDYTINYIAVDETSVTETKVFNITVDESAVIDFPMYKSIMSQNSTLDLSGITAKKGGSSLAVSTRLMTPDDKIITSTKPKLTLSGDYLLEVSAVDGGTTATREYRLRVLVKSSELFTSDATLTPNAMSLAYAQQKNGLKVDFTKNNTVMRYVNAVNVSGYTVDTPLLEYMIMPSVQGAADFSKLTLRLIDKYNERNYISLQIDKTIGEEYAWLSNAKSSALDNAFRGNSWGTITSESTQGAVTDSSFYGVRKKGGTPGSGRVYYDNKEKAFYVGYGTLKNQVLDLDDPEQVLSGNEWGGFSTGEAYMELSFSGLESASGSVLLTNVFGSSLSGEWIQGDSQPSIAIAYAGNSEDKLPVGVVNTKYKLFDAVATDKIDGNLPIIKRVTHNNVNVDIAEDGTFTPTETGVYKIKYTVRSSEKTLAIDVVASATEMSYEFDVAPVSTASVGEEISLPRGKASGGSGYISVGAKLLRENVEVSTDEIYYTFTKSGTYTYRIVLTDYLGAVKNIDSVITVTAVTKPIITRAPSPLRAIINGENYLVPTFEAKNFDANGASTIAQMEVYVMDGENKIPLVMGENWKPNFTVTKTVTMTFVAKSESGVLSDPLVYDITVINEPKKADYFYDVDGAYTKTGGQNAVDYVTSLDNKTLYFANRLLDNVGIELKSIAGKQNFKRINFVVTDSVYPQISVKLSLVSAYGAYYLYINDVRSAKLEFSFINDVYTVFEIENGYFTENNKRVALITECVNGKAFEGFPSMLVNFELSLGGVTGESGISISSINSQIINNLDVDYKAPNVRLFGKYEYEAKLNDTITVHNGIAQDVLSQVREFSVTVKSPSGKKIIDKQSALEKHTFKITEYGVYKITYNAVDSKGNSDPRVTSIAVYDNVPPVITLDSEAPTSGKVNSAVKIPTATVTDDSGNDEDNLSFYIYIIDSDGKITYLDKGEYSFVPTTKGMHRVVYYAYDKDYSSDIVSFFVKVK